MSDPTDPNKVGIATMNKFISSYVKQVFGGEKKVRVLPKSVLCEDKGTAKLELEEADEEVSARDLMKANMKTLGDVLMTYNMNLSLLRFDVENEGKPPSMFLDPNVIDMMLTDRFTNDPAFVYRIRNGLPLVCDRMVILVKGNVTRRRNKITRRTMRI